MTQKLKQLKRPPKLIKTCRASGLPVDPTHAESYKHDYQELYDKVMKKIGFDVKKLITLEMQERSNKLLSRLEKMLQARYPNIAQWAEIKSQKRWLEAVEVYGPIGIARAETGGLAYVILDVGFT